MRARGTGYALTSFDLGYEIDLARAGERLGVGLTTPGFRHKRGVLEPREQRRPLRFTRTIAPLRLGQQACSDVLEVAVYPFGALSLSYTWPVDSSLEDLVDTSVELYENRELLAAARNEAEVVLTLLGDAVRSPDLALAVEDYVIYSLKPFTRPGEGLEPGQRELLARILRAERGPLSEHEVENALDGRIAYRPEELVLVDWFAAMLVGEDMEDERRVLELTTVELVELRFLDGRLEQRLDEAYGLLAGSRGVFGLSPRAREVERLARFQADSAILHENFDNALKFLGDDYLARLYELCSDRFHFAAWDLAIERKLATLESIYSKISDLAARRRAELLEWIIILLFVADILLLFLEKSGR